MHQLFRDVVNRERNRLAEQHRQVLEWNGPHVRGHDRIERFERSRLRSLVADACEVRSELHGVSVLARPLVACNRYGTEYRFEAIEGLLQITAKSKLRWAVMWQIVKPAV